MAIMRNLNWETRGGGRAAGPSGDTGTARDISAIFGTIPGITQPPAPAVPPAVERPAAPVTPTIRPNILSFRPDILSAAVSPPIIPRFPTLLPLPKTTTQLARGAINQLNGANPAMLREAINTIKNKNIAAGGLMNYLERRVKIGEVLNELSKDWSDDTQKDFAEAFQMEPNKLEVMDNIVSAAILNDPELEEELRIENTSVATEKDLLENRPIVWQYPAPGTPLDPPYLVLVAVEHRDVAKAEEVIKSVIDELVAYQGYKIPKTAAQRLG